MSRSMKVLLAVLGGFVVLSLFVPLALIGQLLFGWVGFLRRVIPAVRIDPGSLALGAVCLIAVAVLGHWMASWLWRETHAGSATSRWRIRWTTMSLGVVMLMFVCGIAATGVAHQTGWLMKSEEPMFTSQSRTARVRCLVQMREVGESIENYAEAHDGRLPDSLADLENLDFYRKVHGSIACPSETRLGYVYYGGGLTRPAGADVPVLAEPLANHEGDGMNILFGNGSVRFIKAEEAEAVLARRPR